jgi:hypothetical protein
MDDWLLPDELFEFPYGRPVDPAALRYIYFHFAGAEIGGSQFPELFNSLRFIQDHPIVIVQLFDRCAAVRDREALLPVTLGQNQDARVA